MKDTKATDAAPARGGPSGPLQGLRVLELGHYVSAPLCTRMLADLGAEVIKVETPQGGDPMRSNGRQSGGRSLWWSSLARNKKLVTLDLRQPEGQALALKLAERCDVVVENFRAGQLEKWNLGWDALQRVNPRCILARISGFGQSGPYSQRVAFAPIAEAVGGLTFITGGGAGQPPSRPNVSLGDSITGLNAFGMLLAAIYERDVGGSGRGRCIDIAMYESVFAMMDAAITEYSALGVVRAPSASTVVFSPSGSFRSRDGHWVFITASGNTVFGRLAAAMGRPALATDPRFADNADRVTHRAALHALIGAWVAEHDSASVQAVLHAASVPASKVYSVADCADDAHYRERGSVIPVHDPQAGTLLHPPIAARFDGGGSQPGVAWPGAALGAHNRQVYAGLLGLADSEIEALQRAAVI